MFWSEGAGPISEEALGTWQRAQPRIEDDDFFGGAAYQLQTVESQAIRMGVSTDIIDELIRFDMRI